MNIFYLDKDPLLAARAHVDSHVVKMILEYAQLMCTAHRLSDHKFACRHKMYLITHMNHPSAKWVRESAQNYRWLYQLFYHLCEEYTHRYGKIHKTDSLLRTVLSTVPLNLPETELTPIKLAMPEEYKVDDPVQSYRNYYINGKKDLHKYSFRLPPEWMTNEED